MFRLVPIAVAALLASACVVVVSPPERDDDPVVADECDADMDGVRSLACGGLDCDDLDAGVRPGADEIFGDEVDQDCDGNLDARVDRVDTPARTVPLDWRWGGDLRSIGGVIVTSTGSLAAQELVLAPTFGGGVTLKTRVDYGDATHVIGATRADLGGDVLDFVVRDDRLIAFQTDDGSAVATDVGAFPYGETDLEALATPTGLWLVGCGDEGVGAVLVDDSLQAGVVHHLDGAATRCAPLAGHDGDAQVLIADGTTRDLVRWVLTDESGFTDRLRVASDVSPDRVRTATSAFGAVLAFHDEGRILVFDRDGYGSIVGDGEATSSFDVALSDAGDLLVAWTDQRGVAWATVGPIRDAPAPVPLLDALLADDVTAGLIAGELAVAVQEGASLWLLRARR